MKIPYYFLVTVPEVGMAFTWIGGRLKPSTTAGRVWLTTPDGKPLLEVPKANVYPSTLEQTAARLRADALASKAPQN